MDLDEPFDEPHSDSDSSIEISSTLLRDPTKEDVDLHQLQLPPGAKHTQSSLVDRDNENSSPIMIETTTLPPVIAAPQDSEMPLISVDQLPLWAQPPFTEVRITTLNRVQSAVFDTVFRGTDNVLCCAPTGGGKTNVALLAILAEIAKNVSQVDRVTYPDVANLRVVYLAPMKALVQEVVQTLMTRLQPLGLTVAELSGDQHLSRSQLAKTNVIVATPEKWNIVSSKLWAETGGALSISPDISEDGDLPDSGFFSVQLLILDEIHLLHESRGGVIEAVVARTLRSIERSGIFTRLVGLSATVSNPQDVATFLRVEPANCFVFGQEYRPVPLTSHYVGVAERNPARIEPALTRLTVDRVLDRVHERQVLVFVHSRKLTLQVAHAILHTATKREMGENLWGPNACHPDPDSPLPDHKPQQEPQPTFASSHFTPDPIRAVLPQFQNPALRECVRAGVGLHHAGLTAADRTLVERLFRERELQVLVATATLAWGVNLPAHTVLIRGTQVYRNGGWEGLGGFEVAQMCGRAGRPGLDREGEAFLLAPRVEVPRYLRALEAQVPIESQLMVQVVDLVAGEIAAGAVRCGEDMLQWLGYTYWSVRSALEPTRYGVNGGVGHFSSGMDDKMESPGKGSRIQDSDSLERDSSRNYIHVTLVRSIFLTLAQCGMIEWDLKADSKMLIRSKDALKSFSVSFCSVKELSTFLSANVHSTPVGQIASDFCISHRSLVAYFRHLQPNFTSIEIFSLFSQSNEFETLAVRPEEEEEMLRLCQEVPIPIREEYNTRAAKVNVLLQVWISRIPLENYTLFSDLVYVSQNAPRLIGALYSMACMNCWASLALELHQMRKNVELRSWHTSSPLRQIFENNLSYRSTEVGRRGFVEEHDLSAGEADVTMDAAVNKSMISLATGIPPPIFCNFSERTLRRVEGRNVPWSFFRTMDNFQAMQFCQGNEEEAHALLHVISCIPRIKIDIEVVPLTPALVQLDLELCPDFTYEAALCGSGGVGYSLVVTDVDQFHILHTEPVNFSRVAITNKVRFLFRVTLPVLAPLPYMYLVHLWCESFHGSNHVVPVELGSLVWPPALPQPFHSFPKEFENGAIVDRMLEKAIFSMKTEADVKSKRNLKSEAAGASMFFTWFRKLFPFSDFSPAQSFLSSILLHSTKSCAISAPSGCGKDSLLQMTMFRHLYEVFNDLSNSPTSPPIRKASRVLYLFPNFTFCAKAFSDWKALYGACSPQTQQSTFSNSFTCVFSEQHSLTITCLECISRELLDLSCVENTTAILCTPQSWEILLQSISKVEIRNDFLSSFGLILVNHLEYLCTPGGPALEWGLSCLVSNLSKHSKTNGAFDENGKHHSMNKYFAPSYRVVALAEDASNIKDIGAWLGIPSENCFLLSPSARLGHRNHHISAIPRGELLSYSECIPFLCPEIVGIIKHFRTNKISKNIFLGVPSLHSGTLLLHHILYNLSQEGLIGCLMGCSQEDLKNRFRMFCDEVQHSCNLHKTTPSQVVENLWQSLLKTQIGLLSGVIILDFHGTENLFFQAAVSHEDFFSKETCVCLHVSLAHWLLELYSIRIVNLVIFPLTKVHDYLPFKRQLYSDVVVITGSERHSYPVSYGTTKRSVSQDYDWSTVQRTFSYAHPWRTQVDCYLYTTLPKKRRWERFLNGEAHIIESTLDYDFSRLLLREIALKRSIGSIQDAMNAIGSSFLCQRLATNPSYYKCKDIYLVEREEYLSDLLDSHCDALMASKCLVQEIKGQVPDRNNAAKVGLGKTLMHVIPTPIGNLAALHDISLTTLSRWEDNSLDVENYSSERMKMVVIEMLCHAFEFEDCCTESFLNATSKECAKWRALVEMVIEDQTVLHLATKMNTVVAKKVFYVIQFCLSLACFQERSEELLLDVRSDSISRGPSNMPSVLQFRDVERTLLTVHRLCVALVDLNLLHGHWTKTQCCLSLCEEIWNALSRTRFLIRKTLKDAATLTDSILLKFSEIDVNNLSFQDITGEVSSDVSPIKHRNVGTLKIRLNFRLKFSEDLELSHELKYDLNRRYTELLAYPWWIILVNMETKCIHGCEKIRPLLVKSDQSLSQLFVGNSHTSREDALCVDLDFRYTDFVFPETHEKHASQVGRNSFYLKYAESVNHKRKKGNPIRFDIIVSTTTFSGVTISVSFAE